jgi:AraC-like DNA-binding protein
MSNPTPSQNGLLRTADAAVPPGLLARFGDRPAAALSSLPSPSLATPLAAPQLPAAVAPLPAPCAASPAPRTAGSTLAPWRLRRATDYVETHLGEKISLADLASASGLSRMHFAALFKATTGLRPLKYIQRQRIEYAQAKLANSDLPVVDIALSVGFQSQAHFSTVFKHLVGDSPVRWRQRQTSF